MSLAPFARSSRTLRNCPEHGSRPALDCPYCEPRRIAQAMTDWLVCQRHWDIFAGLTFDLRRKKTGPPGRQLRQTTNFSPCLTENGVRLYHAHYSLDMAERRIRQWLKGAEQLLDQKVCSVVVIEPHQSGVPHVHALVGTDCGVTPDEMAAMEQLWILRNGIAKLEVPRDQRAVVRYVTKWMNADDTRPVFWPDHGRFKSTPANVVTIPL